MGAFDEWVEVQKANKHVEETINSIAYIIKNGVPQISTKEEPSTMPTLIGILIGMVFLLWFFIKLSTTGF
jgi:hypothetical protein